MVGFHLNCQGDLDICKFHDLAQFESLIGLRFSSLVPCFARFLP